MTRRRYEWSPALQSLATDLAERAPSEEEFMALWAKLGDVVWYLVTHDPREPAPLDDAAGMCPNCQTPWKCNGPHLVTQTRWARGEAP